MIPNSPFTYTIPLAQLAEIENNIGQTAGVNTGGLTHPSTEQSGPARDVVNIEPEANDDRDDPAAAQGGSQGVDETDLGASGTEEDMGMDESMMTLLTEADLEAMDLGDIKELYLKQQDQFLELQERLQDIKDANDSTGEKETVPDGSVHRPKNTTLQVAMGLTYKDARYQAILRTVRSFIHGCRVDWRTPWSEVSADVKAKFYAVCREKIKFLCRFHNNWATSAIAAQYTKNLRSQAVRRGDLKRPPKYDYLVETASKRQRGGPRVKKVKQIRNSGGQSRGEGEDDGQEQN
ncbi:hypothetical protein AAF712_016547 [Marasmius tenuissimus]|uniref:Uncharacterized protein n=1 Tax=Marasmius tenuissimus TaxID=585030 RepID=A0ABR2Z6F8_9AGAR